MASALEQLRLLTRLSDDELPDSEAEALLELTGHNVKLAAADALEAVAMTLTSVQSDDISIDGSKRASVLMARAARLREQAAAADEDDGFFFDVVGGVPARPELTERGCW